MKKKTSKRIVRKAEPGETERYQKAAREEEAGKATNQAIGRKVLQERKQQTAAARAALQRLAELKVEQGLSFADLSKSTGIERGNLSRLFSHPTPNVNTDTLVKLATALNATLRMEVEV